MKKIMINIKKIFIVPILMLLHPLKKYQLKKIRVKFFINILYLLYQHKQNVEVMISLKC